MNRSVPQRRKLRNEVVHIFARTNEAAARAEEMVKRAFAQCADIIQGSYDCTVGDDVARSLGQSRLYGPEPLVVVLDHEFAAMAAFQQFIDEQVPRLRRHEWLRMYIACDGVSREQVVEYAAGGSNVFETILENVQLGDELSLDEIEPALVDYFRTQPRELGAAVWRDLSSQAANGTGFLAGVLQLASGGFGLVALCVFWIMHGSPFHWADDWWHRLAFCAAGIYVGHMLLVSAYQVFRKNLSGCMSLAKFVPPLLLAGLLAFVYHKNVAHSVAQWFHLGIAAGVCLDAARRKGREAHRNRRAVLAQYSADQNVDTVLRAGAGVVAADCPIAPSKRQLVILSYARSSKWGEQTAREIHQALKAEGVPSFWDRENIPLGACWHLKLRVHMGYASAFVSIIDEIAAVRPIVADELFAALYGRMSTGCPHVIVIQKNESLPSEALPVFPKVVAYAEKPFTRHIEGIRQIPAAKLIVPVFVSAFRTDFFNMSSFAPRFGRLLERMPKNAPLIPTHYNRERPQANSVFPVWVWRTIKGPAFIAAQINGWLCAPAGLVACAVLIRDNLIGSHTRMALEGFVPWICLYAACLLGSLVRLMIESTLHTTTRLHVISYIVHLVSGVGLSALIWSWGSDCTVLQMLWAAVFAMVGWWLLGISAGLVEQLEPDAFQSTLPGESRPPAGFL